MRLFFIIILQIVLFASFISTSLSADDIDKPETFDISDRISGPRVYIGVGADNIQGRKSFDASAYGAIEAASRVLYDPLGLRLRIGADISEVGVWGGAGLSAEYVFAEDPYYIEASFMAGAYTDFGDLDLGHSLEFRSQIAVGYHFDNNYDIAIGFAHKSNSSISTTNPGSESLVMRIGREF